DGRGRGRPPAAGARERIRPPPAISRTYGPARRGGRAGERARGRCARRRPARGVAAPERSAAAESVRAALESPDDPPARAAVQRLRLRPDRLAAAAARRG